VLMIKPAVLIAREAQHTLSVNRFE
jgi:hypothetical protein